MRQQVTAWMVFGLFVGVALLSLGRGFYTSDGEVMFLTTAALVERGGFEVSPDPGLPQIVVGSDGDYYSKYDPGLPLLAVPFYALGDWIAAMNDAHRYGTAALFVLFLPALAAAGTVSGLYVLAVNLGATRGWALLIAALAGLATPLWVYGRTLFAEAVLACALTWSAALLLSPGRPSARVARALLAGIALGVGIAVRAALAIYALPLLVLLVRLDVSEVRRSLTARIVAFGAGMLPGIALVLWHNGLRFGDGLTFGYSGEGFTTPPWEGIAGLLFSPEHSVLLYAPPLLLSVVLWRRWRWVDEPARSLADVLALAWGIALVFYGLWWAWGGGWAWGPRLLVPLIPLSLLPWLALPTGRGWRLAAAILVALGVVINAAGVLVDVTPHFAAGSGAAPDDSAMRSAAWYALGEVAHGRTEPLALFHLDGLGLPYSWRIGLGELAGALGVWGGVSIVRGRASLRERVE